MPMVVVNKEKGKEGPKDRLKLTCLEFIKKDANEWSMAGFALERIYWRICRNNIHMAKLN